MKPIYTLRIIYITILFCISCSFSNAQTLQVIPDDIYFNNNLGHSTDALTIRDSNGDSYPLPEYSVYEDNRNNPFAYVMGQQSRTIKVVFSDSSPYEYDGMAHLIVNLSVTDGNGIGTVCNVFIPNYYLSCSPCVLNFTSSLPDVGKHEFTWKWDIYAIPVNEPGYCAGWNTTETTHTYYTVLAEPQAPMEEPWTSVLDYACVWASGESTPGVAATKVTESLYSSGFVYDTIEGRQRYGDGNDFELANFVSEIGEDQFVNCLDMAKAVTTFANALGCNLSVLKFKGNAWNYPYDPEYGFWVNLIDPIGIAVAPTNNVFESPPIADDCREGYFKYHAFSVDENNHVWDACLKYNTDIDPDNVLGDPYGSECGVPVGLTIAEPFLLPCNIPDSTYLNGLIDDWVLERGYCNDPFDCGSYEQLGAIDIDN